MKLQAGLVTLASIFWLPLVLSSTDGLQQRLRPPIPSDQKKELVLELHKKLINLESVTGNEHDVGVWLTKFLESHNFTVEHQTLPPVSPYPKSGPRNNIFAYRGASRKTRILLTSHIDTVPPFYPYELRGKDRDQIWGRGSVDAKACVASQIAALMDLLENSEVTNGDVALLYVVGEETGGDGMRKANDLGLSWESVIFGEPTEFKLASGHKGSFTMRVTAHGKAGHSGYPWLGENANHMLLPAISELLKIELPSSDKYGNTTVNIGRMSGGVASNVIAEKSTASIQVRLAGGTAEDAQARFKEVINNVDQRLDVTFSDGYGPVPCDTDIEGFETMTVNYGTDIPWLKGTHKRYLYGPGSILVAHSDHESLSERDVIQAVADYKRLISGALSR